MTQIMKIDKVQELLYIHIDNHRKKSFLQFGIDVRISPTADSRLVRDGSNTLVGWTKYRFENAGNDSVVMYVRIAGNDKDQPEIWLEGRWRPIIAYVERLKPSPHWNTPVTGSEVETLMKRSDQQQMWWMANWKKFQFTRLPRELRDIIYRYALGSYIEPYALCKARRLGIYLGPYSAIRGRMPNANILFTSRLLYQEASAILFSECTFIVRHLSVLSKLLQNRFQYARIRRLELQLDHEDYAKLFGMQIPNVLSIEPSPIALVLQHMELQQLSVAFDGPCGYFSLNRGYVVYPSCQKTSVDWILDAAWPYIRAHPLRVGGYIKHSSRALLEKRKQEERDRVDDWQRQRIAVELGMGCLKEFYEALDEEEGGVRLIPKQDGVEEEIVLSKETPYKCRCKVRCVEEEWSEDD